jgi:hypothetical protein
MGGEHSPLPLIYTQMKLTAVDQLRDRLFKEFGFGYSDNIHEELKSIEKEQIIDAYDAGLFDGSMDDVNDRIYKKYYNETFNNTQS